MCLPIIGAAVGAAASIAGGVMKAQQQQDYVEAINQSRLAAFNVARIAKMREDRRQERFTDKGFRKLNKTRKAIDAESQKADMATAQQEFVAKNEAATGAGFEALAGEQDPSAGNAATVAEKAKIIADAAAQSRTNLSNLGALTAFGSVTGDVTTRLEKNADLLAILNNLRRGSLSVYQNVESQREPLQVDPPDTTMADMLTGFGGLFNRSGGSYG